MNGEGGNVYVSGKIICILLCLCNTLVLKIGLFVLF